MKVKKMLILAQCERIMQLLQMYKPEELKNPMPGSDCGHARAELIKKMHELRRDTMDFEKQLKEW